MEMNNQTNAGNSASKWINISKKTKWVYSVKKLHDPLSPNGKSITVRDGSDVYIISFDIVIEKKANKFQISFLDEPEIRKKVDGED
jgi:hypothetical protein